MKLKKLLESTPGFENRKFGDKLPTLSSVTAAHQAKQVNEVDYSTMRLKSNIDQKWDSTETMLDDMRQYIGAAVAANGPDMGKELADTLKLLMNFAEGESRG
jgi:hypothetical protein